VSNENLIFYDDYGKQKKLKNFANLDKTKLQNKINNVLFKEILIYFKLVTTLIHSYFRYLVSYSMISYRLYKKRGKGLKLKFQHKIPVIIALFIKKIIFYIFQTF